MVDKYDGPERRGRRTRVERIKGIATRVIREGVHLDELEMRRDDPMMMRERVREHTSFLMDKPKPASEPEPEPKKPGAIWAPGVEEISEETHWLLPGSDPEIKENFVDFFQKIKGNNRRSVVLILARAGLGQEVSRYEMFAQMRQMLPDNISLSSSLWYAVDLRAKYLGNRKFDINSRGHGERSFYSLVLKK